MSPADEALRWMESDVSEGVGLSAASDVFSGRGFSCWIGRHIPAARTCSAGQATDASITTQNPHHQRPRQTSSAPILHACDATELSPRGTAPSWSIHALFRPFCEATKPPPARTTLP